MKLWHLYFDRPIGPTYECYLTDPGAYPEEHNYYGGVYEETTLEEILTRFKSHIEFEQERQEKSGRSCLPMTLRIKVAHE